MTVHDSPAQPKATTSSEAFLAVKPLSNLQKVDQSHY